MTLSDSIIITEPNKSNWENLIEKAMEINNYYKYRLEIVSEINNINSALTHKEIEYLLTNKSNDRYLSTLFNNEELEEFDSRSNITRICNVIPNDTSVFKNLIL